MPRSSATGPLTLAVPAPNAAQVEQRLLAESPLESGCFCLVREIRRGDGVRLVLDGTVDGSESWTAQGERRLTPSGLRISAAVSAAQTAGSGLAFLHTHPMLDGVPTLSAIDKETTERLGRVVRDLIDGPFISLVISADGCWAGVTATERGLEPLSISVAGRHLRTWPAHGARVPVSHNPLDDRQTQALGVSGQRVLQDLVVAVIGAGGLGSPVAETLVRMGVGEVVLVDDDVLDTPSNLRRIFGASSEALKRQRPPHKSELIAEYLNGLGIGSLVTPIVGDIREPSTQGKVLRCHLLINGTDTHSSRAAVTELAVRAALPAIDIGVRVGARLSGQLDALLFERRVLIPEGPCLWCWQRLDAERIRLELMPAEQRSQLIHEGYVTGFDDGPAPSVAALTVTAAGSACAALLALISGAFDVAPLAVSVDAVSMEMVPFDRDEPDPNCICQRWRLAHTPSPKGGTTSGTAV